MAPTDSLESAIQKELRRVYLCTLDELCALLPHFSRAEVAAMVEHLTQEGAIASRSSDPSRSILWLPPARPGKRRLEGPVAESPPDPDHSRLAYETWTQSGAPFTVPRP